MLNGFKILVSIVFLTAAGILSAKSVVNIEFYGLAHLSYDNVDDGLEQTQHVASNSSRLGIKGSRSISDNLKVIFQYESGVDLTAQGVNDGNGGAFSAGQIFTKGRPSFIGVKGNMGTVLMGHYNGLDQWANDFNFFADQVGDLGNLWEGSGLPGRLDNVMFYQSPKFNDTHISLTLVPGEEDDSGENVILKADYGKSNLKLGLAYSKFQTAGAADDHTGIALTAKYSTSKFTLGFGFQTEADTNSALNDDRDSLAVGGAFKVNDKVTAKVQYAVSTSDFDNADATQIALGLDYSLDSNNTLYIALASMDNDDNVNFSVNGKGHGDKIVPLPGEDMATLSIGFVSSFEMGFKP